MIRERFLRIYTMALALAASAGLAACGQTDTGPAPAERAPSAQQTGDSDDGCQTISQTININSQSDLADYADLSCFDVEGHVFVQETDDIQDLSALSGLRSVTGFVGIADNTALTSAQLPNLEEAGEGLVLEGNTALVSTRFDSLRDIGGYLHVFNNPALESASFPWLFSVGDDVIFAGVDALTTLELPKLTCVMGTFIFEHSDGLECLCLPNLVVVLDDFRVHFNGGIRSVSAPVLTTVLGNIDIRRNPQLEHLDLDCLEQVGGNITVTNNHLLAQCRVDELIDEIAMIGGDTIIGDNLQTCPDQPVTAEDVGCAPCTTGICVADDGDVPPGDDDDDVGVPDAGDDVGVPDVGVPDAGDDAGVPDAGDDAGVPDAGDDAGVPDVGVPDASEDAGVPDTGDDDDDVDGDLSIQSASLQDNPSSTLSGFLDLQTSRPAFVTVTATSGAHTFEMTFDEEALADQRLPLIGFRPDRTYQLDVRAYTQGGAAATQQLTFQSGPLPDNFAPLDVTVAEPNRMQSGIILFNVNRWTPQVDNSWSYIVGIDTSGEVVWYYQPEDRAQDVELLQNGNIVFNTSQSEIVEINVAGEVINRWSANELGFDYFHHEITELPNGNLVTLASELRRIPGYGPQNDITYPLIGDIIVEFTPDGQVVNQHSTFDMLDPFYTGISGFFGGYWNARYHDEATSVRDWTHGNAVHYVPEDDTFLYSTRHLDWIVKVDRQTGEVIWRLGHDGDFELTSGDWFYHQHDPMVLENGNIILYDNGEVRPGLETADYYSRAVEYSIDATGANPNTGSKGTAQQVWEFNENQSFYSAFVSGVDKLPNGNVLIADGARTIDQTLGATDPNNLLFARIVEVTDGPNPQKVLEVMIRDYSGQYGYTMYRASHYDLLDQLSAL